MKYDLKRHRLLKYLRRLPDNEKEIKFKDLPWHLKVKESKIDLYVDELSKAGELTLFSNPATGVKLWVAGNATVAISNKKYISRYWTRFGDRCKTVVQIFIPVLALAVTILVTYISILDRNTHKSSLEELEDRIEILESLEDIHNVKLPNK